MKPATLAMLLLTLGAGSLCEAADKPPVTPPFVSSNRFLLPTFITLQALDAGATEYGFHQRDWVEHNPLIPHSTAGRMTYFGLTGAGVVLGSVYLEHKGHSRWSKALLVGAIAVEGYASVHTLRGLQR